MPTAYLFAAMKSEARPVQRMFLPRPDSASDFIRAEGLIGTNRIALFITGMGPRRARDCAKMALDSNPVSADLSVRPDAVIVIGTCGSLSVSLPENTIVTYTNCLSGDLPQSAQTCSAELNDC